MFGRTRGETGLGRLLLQSSAIDEIIKVANRANSRSRQRGISRSDPFQNIFLVRSGREDRKIAAAVEDRVGEGDSRPARFTDNRQNALPILPKRQAVGKKGRCVPIIADAQQGHIENGSILVEARAAVKVLEQRLIT